MLTGDSRSVAGVVNETFSTPRRAQKRLFTSGSTSSKRNLFSDNRHSASGGGNSGDESDLGPMSPLALSDATPSSRANSPRRMFDSPLAAFVPGPSVSLGTLDSNLWERTAQNKSQDEAEVVSSSPFRVLNMLTRSARYSQHRKLCPNSPESVPKPVEIKKSPPTTPKRTNQSSTWNEEITDTPRRRFGREIQNERISDYEIITETPQKDDSPDKRLITPLGSVSKEVPLPRLQHRKSLSSLATDGNTSPVDSKENLLKRTARDAVAPTFVKFFKSDECSSIPRARAALFQERKEEFKLTTKSFYSSPPQVLQTRESPVSVENRDPRRGQKRRSLPAKINRARSSKRHRYGEINAGIGHGIRKPKLKKHVSRAEAFKKDKVPPSSIPSGNQLGDSSIEDFSQNDQSIETQELTSCSEIDAGKKFFKTNKTLARNSLATVTVNGTIKLQVSNGRVKLKPHQTRRRNLQKKTKDIDLSFDANDLTVDDPTFAAPIDGNSVANILKVLEDDWANDEYDTMESLTILHRHDLSPLKPSMAPIEIMSPASELINMTSVMNIEDAGCIVQNNDSNYELEEPKFFPLFEKKFSGNQSISEMSTKKSGRGTRSSISWQLLTKNGRNDDRQYQLDAGQKQFGATQCLDCGVIYQIGDPEDERSHQNYHDSMKILKFSGWKQERVVGTDPYTASRIILVEPGDSKHCWKKVSEILTVVDRDLGLADDKVSDYRNDKIYLYIRDKEIIGVLVAEYVTAGYRMIPDLLDIDCCSSEMSAAKCGVKVVWTTMSRRRQGIATKLMDVLRANFYFGYVLTVDDIAFSTPTPGGKEFAEKYTKTRCFKVYN